MFGTQISFGRYDNSRNKPPNQCWRDAKVSSLLENFVISQLNASRVQDLTQQKFVREPVKIRLLVLTAEGIMRRIGANAPLSNFKTNKNVPQKSNRLKNNNNSNKNQKIRPTLTIRREIPALVTIAPKKLILSMINPRSSSLRQFTALLLYLHPTLKEFPVKLGRITIMIIERIAFLSYLYQFCKR
ncbi:hypothetical protein TNCV_2814511 [Trichonephila clavipes]|nr:hypothetical protein TNCV_2814511 [Trichonephila clavipes]